MCDGPVRTYPRGTDDPRRPGCTSAVAAAGSAATTEPTALGEWLDRAGRLAHCVLYALVIAVPVAGIALQFARGDALPLFGLSEMPSPGPANRALARTVKEAHEVFAHALVIFAGISCGRGADPSLGLRRTHLCADAVEIKAIIGF